MHGSLSVNTFFLISGLLTMNGSLYYYKKAKRFNIIIYVLHRIWRFIPLLALTLSLTFILPILGSGPIWHETVSPVVKNCQKNWWKTLLLINYLIDSDNICLLHTWYLGCDFHFYLLALIVILPVIYNRKKLAIINNSTLIIFGTIITGVVLYKNNYPPTLLYAQPKVNERLKLVLDFYIKPYSHIGSYCIGLFLALIIAFITPKQKKLLLSPNYLMLGWILTALSFATILFAIYPWNKGEEPNIITSVIYGSIHRTLWSTSIAWIVFVCINGYGGVVNNILSFSALIPFSRLTYAVFLIHPIVHWMKLGTLRERIFVSHYDGLYAFIPTLVLTFGFSMICGLLCESPFLAIEQFFIKKFIKSKQQPTSHNFDL